MTLHSSLLNSTLCPYFSEHRRGGCFGKHVRYSICGSLEFLPWTIDHPVPWLSYRRGGCLGEQGMWGYGTGCLVTGISTVNIGEIFMNDNTTPHKALVYDEQVSKTIPEYELFHNQIIDLVSTYNDSPSSWLDTGCGTGTFVTKALNQFKDTFFNLADPSVDMLNIAKTKI